MARAVHKFRKRIIREKTPLAALQSFESKAFDSRKYERCTGIVYTGAEHITGTLHVKQSIDGTHWDYSSSFVVEDVLAWSVELSSLFNELERTAVVTGGGYASFPDWKVDYYDDDGFYPLLSRRALDLPLHEFGYLLIHDYFIHDYFKDTDINPQKMRPEDSAEMRRAYAARVRAIVPSLKEHIERLPGKILITADHGEEFFECENFYHHGSFSGSSLVYRVPLFYPSEIDVLRPEPVTTKKEIERFLGFGKS